MRIGQKLTWSKNASAVLAALSIVVAISGCGSSSSCASGSTARADRCQITRVVTSAIETTRSACDRDFTVAGLESWTITYDSQAAALQKCYAASVAPHPSWLKSARIQVGSDRGSSAIAVVSFSTGPQQNSRRRIDLVYQGGWKINEIRRCGGPGLGLPCAGGSSGSAANTPSGNYAADITATTQLLSGLPQAGPTLGSATAPVKLTVYCDLESPECRALFLTSGLPQLITNDVRTGAVQITYSAFQTATQAQQTFTDQQIAALAAGKQMLFWDYVELFYREQGTEMTNYVTESYLDGLAGQVPRLNHATWTVARQATPLATQLQQQEAAAKTAGIIGTPTLVLEGPRGKVQPQSAEPGYTELESDVSQVK